MYIQCLLSVMIGICGFMLGEKHINLPAYFDTTMTALPFFVCGHYCKKYISNMGFSKYWLCVVLILLSAVLFLSWPGDPVFARNEYGQNILQLYGCGMAGVFLTLMISEKIGNLPLFSYWGRYSLIILVMHRPLIEPILYVINLLHLSEWITALSVLFVVMACFLIIIPIMCKYCPHITGQKDLITLKTLNMNT